MLNDILNVIGKISIYIYITVFLFIIISIISIKVIRFIRELRIPSIPIPVSILILPALVILFKFLIEYVSNADLKNNKTIEDK